MKRLDLGELVESRLGAAWREWKAEYGGGFVLFGYWLLLILVTGVLLGFVRSFLW